VHNRGYLKAMWQCPPNILLGHPALNAFSPHGKIFGRCFLCGGVVGWWQNFLIFKNNIFLIKNSRILKIIISNSVTLQPN
jgi:hypothetical protein